MILCDRCGRPWIPPKGFEWLELPEYKHKEAICENCTADSDE